jgi:replicative superfamily II helicase
LEAGDSFFYEFSHLDTACFEVFLKLLSEQYPDVLNVIQLDQAPAHSSQKLQIPENFVLLYQPSHSPELNPIERVWEDLKLDFKGENYANLDELRTAIREALGYMTPDWMASLTQYAYIMKALSVSVVNRFGITAPSTKRIDRSREWLRARGVEIKGTFKLGGVVM